MHIYNINGGIGMSNAFNIKYCTDMDKLEKVQEGNFNKVWAFCINHKFFITILISLVILMLVNLYLVCAFFKIMNMWYH